MMDILVDNLNKLTLDQLQVLGNVTLLIIGVVFVALVSSLAKHRNN